MSAFGPAQEQEARDRHRYDADLRQGRRQGHLDFEIDMASRTARCPAGKLSVRASLKSYGSGPRRMHFFFSRSDCMTCPLRGSCTTSKLGFKTITVHEDYDRLRDLRDQQRTPEFKQAYPNE
jgi:hypothetical protein